MATLRDCVYGMAVADALGVPFEFKARGSFECTDMVGFGSHHQPAGTWSDDTSMALCICDSYRELGRIVPEDIMDKFRQWAHEGAYTVDGLFDIGITCSRAINSGHGLDGEYDNGNGSLMRTTVMAFMNATDDEIRAVSALTHAHPMSTEACVRMVHLACQLADGAAIADVVPQEIATLPQDEVKSSGFVRHTETAALWCLANTSSYRDCALVAVNLGDDTDTTAAVAGALAGIAYGMDAIPADWLRALRGKDVIERAVAQ